ncbi:hypothetical protein [Sphingobacterium psychroaquaticum]|uniref:POTRA domain-containing protein, ShlB-type n=2 Tax=Sphingobacterium psychroaquaticum TaxID=561061 RepID=A0A1X7HVE1_9SPHI|nr:hypothetical protein [Sphingobacterium psychroaquaticum]SMG05813.1 hypothetical protein SAMN05660862_0078 [Sphingobacterium psychroaquaticum]
MRKYLILLCLLSYALYPSAETLKANQIEIQKEKVSYAYIRIEGKFLSKKLKVNVDLGDSEKQLEDGMKLSQILTNTRSYAAVLNYMAEIGYELVNTLDLTKNSDGTGGTSGIVYVMKKTEPSDMKRYR